MPQGFVSTLSKGGQFDAVDGLLQGAPAVYDMSLVMDMPKYSDN